MLGFNRKVVKHNHENSWCNRAWARKECVSWLFSFLTGRDRHFRRRCGLTAL